MTTPTDLPQTTPMELIGDVKKLEELKTDIDKEFISFSNEMYRRGTLLIKLHEAILLENLKKQRVLEKVKQLLESIDTAATLDATLQEQKGGPSLEELEAKNKRLKQRRAEMMKLLEEKDKNYTTDYYAAVTKQMQDKVKPRRQELSQLLSELQEKTTILEAKQKELITAQLRFTSALAEIALTPPR